MRKTKTVRFSENVLGKHWQWVFVLLEERRAWEDCCPGHTLEVGGFGRGLQGSLGEHGNVREEEKAQWISQNTMGGALTVGGFGWTKGRECGTIVVMANLSEKCGGGGGQKMLSAEHQ